MFTSIIVWALVRNHTGSSIDASSREENEIPKPTNQTGMAFSIPCYIKVNHTYIHAKRVCVSSTRGFVFRIWRVLAGVVYSEG